jgi:hypothetical protein
MNNDKTHENNPYYSWIEYLNINSEIFFMTIRNMQLLWDEFWKVWTGESNRTPNKEP